MAIGMTDGALSCAEPEIVRLRAGQSLMYGKKKMGIVRSTFLIDAGRIIQRVWRSVKVDGHDAAVIEALRELKSGSK